MFFLFLIHFFFWHPGNAVHLFLLGSPAGGHPRTPVQGSPCTRPNLLSPPYLKEDLKPLPQPLANLWQGA